MGLRLDGDLQRMINEETEAIDVLFPLEKASVWMAKKQCCFRPCNVFREHVPFCAPTTSLSVVMGV